MTTLDTVKGLADQLPELIASHEQTLAEKRAQMNALKTAGLVYASEHWREGKYMYLLYPSKAGEARVRKYIGTDPAKIADAQAGIQRGKEYERLQSEIQTVESRLMRGQESLRQAIGCLSGRWW